MGGAQVVNHGKAESAAKEVIKKLTQKAATPYQKRSNTMICSFYVKGNCKRADDCPFAHEMPAPKIKKSTLRKENIKVVGVIEPSKESKVIYADPENQVTSSDVGLFPSQKGNLLGTSTRSFKE
jgi:pre-mRNA-splicing factor RBM22/SLT11